MKQFSENYLKALINRSLDDIATVQIQAGLIGAGGQENWNDIRKSLQKWEKAGYLKILKDPENSKPEDIVVEMISFIDRRSSIPGFLNWS